METPRLNVPYFVKSTEQHDRQYAPGTRARSQLELEIEGTFYEHVQGRWGGRGRRERRGWGVGELPSEIPSLEPVVRDGTVVGA
jgi:hypothetical protein